MDGIRRETSSHCIRMTAETRPTWILSSQHCRMIVPFLPLQFQSPLHKFSSTCPHVWRFLIFCTILRYFRKSKNTVPHHVSSSSEKNENIRLPLRSIFGSAKLHLRCIRDKEKIVHISAKLFGIPIFMTFFFCFPFCFSMLISSLYSVTIFPLIWYTTCRICEQCTRSRRSWSGNMKACPIYGSKNGCFVEF